MKCVIYNCSMFNYGHGLQPRSGLLGKTSVNSEWMNCCQFHLRVRHSFILFSEHSRYQPGDLHARCKKLPTFESGLSARSSRYRASIIPLSANCRKCICVRGQRILRQNAKMKMRRPLRHNREQDLVSL